MRVYSALYTFLLFLMLLGAHVSTAAEAERKFAPALLYLAGDNEGDSPFIKSAMTGVERIESELHKKVQVVGLHPREDMAAALRRVADSGASPILVLGSQNAKAVMAIAEKYPKIDFTVIDGMVPPIYPNVQSIIFKDNEGAFLVGYIAGKVSHTGRIGFIGGMDIPPIRNFQIGFIQGVKYATEDASVHAQMVGNTPEAWGNPTKAHEIARALYQENIDIIFAAAGASNFGVLKAAEEANRLAIGVDLNQNGLYPGRVLTSMVKRVDFAVHDTLKNYYDKNWSAGLKYLGLKEGALDYAVDQNNRALINEELIEQVATARDRIIDGKIVVESYSAK